MDSQLKEQIVGFFAKNPTCLSIYTSLDLFHVTHSSLVEKIEAIGLIQSPGVTDDTATAFLEEMFSKYGTGHPNDRIYLDNFILGMSEHGSPQESRGQYLSAHKPCLLPDAQGRAIGYVIPERVIFMLRGLHQVATLEYFSPKEQKKALELFEKSSKPFFEENGTAIVLKIDPMADAVLKAIFSSFHFNISEDEISQFGVDGVTGISDYLDLWCAQLQDLVVCQDLRPEDISIFSEHPINLKGLIGQCTTTSPLFSDIGPQPRSHL